MTNITRRSFMAWLGAVAATLGIGQVVPQGPGTGMRPAQPTTRPTLIKAPPPFRVGTYTPHGRWIAVAADGTIKPANAATDRIIGIALEDIPAGGTGWVRIGGKV